MPSLTPSQKKAGAAMGAAVIALTATFVPKWEGTKQVGYVDLVGVATSCTGHTGPDAVVGRRYTVEECRAQLSADLEKHAAGIRPCVPASTPVEAQVAFLSLAFNVGVTNFCSSSLARKLKAGDLAGACAEISRWDRAGGRRIQGLANRRADERRLCERGLTP